MAILVHGFMAEGMETFPSSDLVPTAVSERLSGMTARERLNSIIQVEIAGEAPDGQAARASEIEILWKLGNYDGAIEALTTLESLSHRVGVGLQWMVPVAGETIVAGIDRRIGTGSSAEGTALDLDPQSENLFAVVDWGASVGWTLNLSTDGGRSWVETYLWSGDFEYADMAVVGSYVYIAYSVGTEARLRRASTVDGQIDLAYNDQLVLDTTPSTPMEIRLANAAEDRIDYSILLDSGTIRHLWDSAASGSGFSETSPLVSDAAGGLATTRNIGWPGATGEYFLMLSYVASDDSIHLYRLGGSGWDGGTTIEPEASGAKSTSIAAYEDTVMVAFEKEMAQGQGITYRVSDDGGTSWAEANLAIPSAGGSFFRPLVSARSGSGTAAFYQQQWAPMNVIQFQQRHNYAPGTWMPRTRVNDYDFATDFEGFDADWIGSGWGLLYVDAAGAAWFAESDSIFYAGFEKGGLAEWSSWQGSDCVIGTDTDGDRLDDCFETDTGVYLGPTETGTDPTNADTDGDSIDDGDEVLGTLAGLDLPAMGTNPLRKDVLVEYDWMVDILGCGLHEHRPTGIMIARLTNAFAAAPVFNPDGSTGINYIHDYGQGGVFSGGNALDDGDVSDPNGGNGILVGGVNGSEFSDHKANNFASNRVGYFHYAILPHYYNTNSASSGQAELNGDDLIVSLRCGAFSTQWVSHTIAHELGHNLDLRHGGHENCNYKPNYNSVMNYKYQLNGVDGDCNTSPNGILDYSYGDRVTLNENNLDENLGVCGAPPIDWNGNGKIESGVSQEINPHPSQVPYTCGGTLTTLQDHNDWAHLSFAGILDSDGIPTLQPREIIDCLAPSSD